MSEVPKYQYTCYKLYFIEQLETQMIPPLSSILQYRVRTKNLFSNTFTNATHSGNLLEHYERTLYNEPLTSLEPENHYLAILHKG